MGNITPQRDNWTLKMEILWDTHKIVVLTKNMMQKNIGVERTDLCATSSVALCWKLGVHSRRGWVGWYIATEAAS